MEETVIVISHIRARRGYEAIVRDTLKKLIAPARAEEGCLDYKLYESATEATLFVLYQVWASEKHLKSHNDRTRGRLSPHGANGPGWASRSLDVEELSLAASDSDLDGPSLFFSAASSPASPATFDILCIRAASCPPLRHIAFPPASASTSTSLPGGSSRSSAAAASG